MIFHFHAVGVGPPEIVIARIKISLKGREPSYELSWGERGSYREKQILRSLQAANHAYINHLAYPLNTGAGLAMRHILSTVLLGPVLVVQGKLARVRTPKLPEPEGIRAGTIGDGSPLKLLVLGDSSAAGVGANHQSEALLGQILAHLGQEFTVSYRLLAKTGATTADCLQWLDEHKQEQFDVVVTAMGVNDVTALRSKQRWISEQKRLLSTLQNRFSRAPGTGFWTTSGEEISGLTTTLALVSRRPQ